MARITVAPYERKSRSTLREAALTALLLWAGLWSIMGPISFIVWLDLVNAWPFN